MRPFGRGKETFMREKEKAGGTGREHRANAVQLSEDSLVREGTSYAGWKIRLQEFRGWEDCDVLFPETGYILRHVNYGLFLFGNVRNFGDCEQFGDKPTSRKIGDVITAYDGKRYCIVDARSSTDVTLLSDSGMLEENVRMSQARSRGTIQSAEKASRAGKDRRPPAKCWPGFSVTNAYGDTGTITAVHPPADSDGAWRVDVRFERDGAVRIAQNVPFSRFISGKVRFPAAAGAPPCGEGFTAVNRQGYAGKAVSVYRRGSGGWLVDAEFDKDGRAVMARGVPFEAFAKGDVALSEGTDE